MHSIVIARYQEDLGWIAAIPDEFEIFIYNKGDPILDPVVVARAHHIVNRPNIGRESETYLYHMLHQRREDGGYTVFTQGDPFEHSPDLLALLQNWRAWGEIQPLACQWKTGESVPPPVVLETFQAGHPGQLRVRPERFSLYTWGPLEFIDVGAFSLGVDYRHVHSDMPSGSHIASHFLDMCEMYELAELSARHAVGLFSYGAIFAVRNHRLRAIPARNLEIMNYISKGAACYGYIFERLWLHLFGAQFETPRFPAIAYVPDAAAASLAA